MSERDAMLRKISSAQFAAWELHIYLDTHPNDTEALKSYKKYSDTFAALAASYSEKYGPLTARDAFGNTSWEWINNPWPWEIDKEAQV